jgi:hypothetical protein
MQQISALDIALCVSKVNSKNKNQSLAHAADAQLMLTTGIRN